MTSGTDHPFALPGDDRDRLAELGQLAGGLVHELKNPLGVITLNAELLQQQNPFRDAEQERAAKRLGRIVDSARNLQQIIQAFLAYAKPSRPDRDAVDANELLRELVDEQTESFKAAGITVHLRSDPELPFLPADRQHLRSIFGNVIGNARDALKERKKERTLLIVTRSAPGAARVMIANNGPPLPQQVAAHLFEPFHSTKDDGTGLGLAIVRRLTELHGGTIQVSSDPDQGVSFTFEFPTPLGPAPKASLPLPDADAVVRDEPGSGVGGRGSGSGQPQQKLPKKKKPRQTTTRIAAKLPRPDRT
jgi:signal transduction histidine kinase